MPPAFKSGCVVCNGGKEDAPLLVGDSTMGAFDGLDCLDEMATEPRGDIGMGAFSWEYEPRDNGVGTTISVDVPPGDTGIGAFEPIELLCLPEAMLSRPP